MISMMWYWNLPSCVWLSSPVVENITSYRTSPVLQDFWLLHHCGKHIKLQIDHGQCIISKIWKMDFEIKKKKFALMKHVQIIY